MKTSDAALRNRFDGIAARRETIPATVLERTVVGALVDDLRTMQLLVRRSAADPHYACDLLATVEQRVTARIAFLTLFIASRVEADPSLADRYADEQDYLHEIERLALCFVSAAESSARRPAAPGSGVPAPADDPLLSR